SKADCYVELHLPTASPVIYRTRVIDNSSDPEWNETFQYRIHDAIKNTLELTLFDKDVLISDELTSVVFDVTGIQAGHSLKNTFKLKEDKEELDVEFFMEKSSEPPGEIITNGVLVAYPCLYLQGRINNDQNTKMREQGRLSLPGSYEKQLSEPCKPNSDQACGIPFVFHIGTIPLNLLPVGKEVDITLPLGKGLSVDLKVKAEEITKDLDVRLGFDLCKEEREFLEKRKKIVPVVAVLGSGGGIRALSSFYGSLLGLQQLNLLDSITYLAGISVLYQDHKWSQKDLKHPISNAQDKISSSKAAVFSSEHMKYYFQELNALENSGRNVSFTDLWGLIVEYFLQQKEDQSKLSDQQEAVKYGQNPYPIYAAVNVRPNVRGDDFAEWCEFTPYEVGFRKYGAFIRTEDFDSEFFMGRLIKKHPEPRICYLQGMWGSAFAASLDDVCLKVVGSGFSFLETLGDVVKVIDDSRRFHFRDPTRLKTRLVIPGGPLLQIIQDFFKSRITAGETFNFMQGLYLHRDYISLKKFVISKETHLDAFPNMLTPMEENLYLVDGGFSINSPFPLLIQPERDVDVILSFNYSWEAPFEVLELTEKYCRERDIPFPEIIFNKEDEESPKECYLFMDAENPKAPIVLHFPLVNDTFRKYKMPGIERESEEEKTFADFQIEGKDSPYRTFNFTYTSDEFDRLVQLNCYNVLNNVDAILKALRLVSKSDCYVALKLPTASPLIKRTPVVYNSSDPEWNETFQYRIHSAVKVNLGILLSSLNSYDTSVAFDLGNIAPGQNLTHTFVLNSEEGWSEDLQVKTSLVGNAIIPVSELPLGKEVELTVPLGRISSHILVASQGLHDAYWSQRNLQNAVGSAQKIVTSGKVGAFSAEQLAYYFQELIALEKTGRKATLVDLWGLIIEYILNNKKDPMKLSDQQKAVIKGQNPYPIYAAQNVRMNIKTSEFAEWVEYTPYEFGIHKYGAFIRMEDYGSNFFMGLLLEKHEEPRICFLQGIWASAFAGNIDDMWEDAEISQLKFTESVKDAIRIVGIMPGGVFTHLFSNLVKSRITTGENFNFLHGLHLHQNYVNDQEFVAWKGTHLDAVPNQLTPEESSLHLVDGGFAINSPFPLVLQPERDVDVIFSFNYSWQAPFEVSIINKLKSNGLESSESTISYVLHQTQRYCEERGIPFPHIAVTDSDKKQPEECYMFLNATDLRAPIILHFPLCQKMRLKKKDRKRCLELVMLIHHMISIQIFIICAPLNQT
ncbi:Cytosolic phospholipase A2 zeta, partial [Ophiophagus hannah]